MGDVVKTRAQVIERAGINLGAVQPGEPLSAEDYATLDNLLDPVIALLSADNVIEISDSDEFDVDIFLPLAACLANQAGPSFGSAINDQAWIRDTGILRRIAATRPTFEAQKADYF